MAEISMREDGDQNGSGKVAVTGAAGQLGSRVAEQLLKLRQPDDIVLITRRPESLKRFADLGVTLRRADLDEPGTLRAAFDNVESLLLISTTHQSTPHRVEQHGRAIAAAADVGVRRIAFTSMPKIDADHPSGFYAQEYVKSEALLRDSGLEWTTLQNAPYAEYLVGRLALALSKGRLISNAGDGRTAPVSNDDCAAVAAAVLTGVGHAGKTYVVTGGELFTQDELAALAAEITGRELPLLTLDDDAFIEQAALDGVPAPMPTYLSTHLRAVRLGYFDDCTDVVQTITGRAPKKLRDVLQEHRDELLALLPAG
jgi:NAD(P)H dehydrogenase (quinone)